MVKKTFRVKDMHCANCVMTIESIEDDLPGVRQVSASYKKMQVTVEFDESKVSEAQFIEAVKKKVYSHANRIKSCRWLQNARSFVETRIL